MAIGNRRSIIDNALNDIHSGKSSPINADLFNLYHKNYVKGIDQVFTKAKEGSKAWEKVRQFKLNTAKLAAAKSYKQTAELQKLAANSASLAEFKKNAAGIINRYNRYQAAEYNTIVARTRTAAQFERFEDESNDYPNLEWLLTVSADPRELHLSYVGIILPIDDPFWEENQPGDLWNCKCDWRTTDKEPTSLPDKVVRPSRGLEGNPWKTGELITEQHPYFKGIPGWVSNNAMLLMPDDLAFIKVETKEGTLLEHVLMDGTEESPDNRSIAKSLLKDDFKEIKLLPKIYASEVALRERYYGEKYNEEFPSTTPDAKVDGKIIEFKRGNINTLSMRIGEGARQSDIVLIKSKDKLSNAYLERLIKGQWEIDDRKNISTIILINGGKTYVFKRP